MRVEETRTKILDEAEIFWFGMPLGAMHGAIHTLHANISPFIFDLSSEEMMASLIGDVSQGMGGR